MSTTYNLQNWKRLPHDTPKVWDVNDLLERIKLHGDKTVYKYFESNELKDISYSEFHTLITNISAGLVSLGLKGKRVAVIGETSPQWLATYVGALAAGSVIIPMDKELAVSEIEKFLTMVEADAIVYSKTFNEKLESAMANHPTLNYFIPIEAPANASELPKVLPFNELVMKGAQAVEDGYKIKMTTSRDEMCEMLFTSGTTGTSKIVMLSQKNIFSAVSAAYQTVPFTDDEVLVSVLPVHHTYELMCLLAGMVLGMTVCINDSLRHVMKNFKLCKPTGLVLVPLFLNTMYKKIWSEAEKSGRDKTLKTGMKMSRGLLNVGIDARRKIFKTVIDSFGGNLTKIVCGGAKLNPELVQFFDDMGIGVFEGFGITECSPLVAVTPYYARKPGSIGPAVPCCKMRIDPNGEVTEEGYPMGEIQVKGDNVMIGYYNNPEANSEVFTDDGWFRTGDVGYLDSDGYAYITGRIKFVIVLENGKNVFPEEIEEYLEAVDTISESCVIGRKAEDSDEVVLTAVVYPDFSKFPANVTDDEIKETIRKNINAVNKRLPSFKQIKSVEIRKTEFEKTTTKKIKRQLVK